MMTPKTSDKKPEKPKSREAQRAVMKPEKAQETTTDESTWKGGVDRFSERV